MKIIEEREAVGILPKERDRIAIEVRHHQFGLLLLRQRRVSGRRETGRQRNDLSVDGRQSLGVEGITVVGRHFVCVDVQTVVDTGVRMIRGVGVGGIEWHRPTVDGRDRLGNEERRDCTYGSVGIDDLLHEAGSRAR